MQLHRTKFLLFIAGFALTLLGGVTHAQSHTPSRETIKPTFQAEPPNAPGLVLTGVTVDYKPGGATPPHRHGQAFVVAYVLSGAVVSKVNDGEERVFHAGESWTEDPGAHHVVSRNASATEPAKVLVLFLAPKSEKSFVYLDKR